MKSTWLSHKVPNAFQVKNILMHQVRVQGNLLNPRSKTLVLDQMTRQNSASHKNAQIHVRFLILTILMWKRRMEVSIAVNVHSHLIHNTVQFVLKSHCLIIWSYKIRQLLWVPAKDYKLLIHDFQHLVLHKVPKLMCNRWHCMYSIFSFIYTALKKKGAFFTFSVQSVLYNCTF